MTEKIRFMMTTLGCKVNQFETDAIALALQNAGWVRTPKGHDAHVCIINTCTVTGKASTQSRQAIRHIIRQCPHAEIIVTGCYAQTEAEEISQINGVHRIISHREKHLIPEMILSGQGLAPSSQPLMSPDCNHSCTETTFASPDLTVFGKRTRPFLKIQDGCDAFCTYCIVPHTRGRSRSMEKNEVLKRLFDLGQAGFKEVVLTGIHIGNWGADLKPAQSFTDLLKAIEAKKPVPRIRISSIEPVEITDDMVNIMASSSMFCPHAHIPLQCGDNDILKRMKRPYDRDFFKDRVLALVSAMPHAAIGCDVMVGFPGETNQAFENTYNLIESLPVMYLHVFPYSPRPKTPAAAFPDQVHPDIVKKRTERLRNLSAEKKARFLKRLDAQTLEVLIESKRDRKSGLLKGLTQNYATVMCDGQDNLFNTLQQVIIKQVYNDHLKGSIDTL